MKIIVGSQGRINELIKGLPDKDLSSPFPFGDGKIMIGIKGDFVPSAAGEVQIKEIIKEVIKEVDTQETLEILIQSQENEQNLIEQIQTLKDTLADALNAEDLAKKEAEDLKGELKVLKGKFTKLKKKFLEEE